MKTCGRLGIEVVGVTKACLGEPAVAAAMLAGGAVALADSRVQNLRRLRSAGTEGPVIMLRLPMLSEAVEVCKLADVSFNTELDVMEALGRAAIKNNRKHAVILMVDTGDGREGLLRQETRSIAAAAGRLSGIALIGIGTNVSCLTDGPPTVDQLRLLTSLAFEIGHAGDQPLMTISGGNSSAWSLVETRTIPQGINQLRLGEAILLGQDPGRNQPIKRMHHDAFVIEAEVIESLPGRHGRVIAAIGRQDIDDKDLRPSDPSWSVVKASSDHLVMNRTGPPANAGDIISFIPGYQSLLRAMTSSHVVKQLT